WPRRIGTGGSRAIKATIKLADHLMAGVQERAAAAAALGDAGGPLRRPERRIGCVKSAERNAFEGAGRMMNAGESFACRRLIHRPTEKAHATGRGAVKAQKRKTIRAAGQAIGPARGFAHAA